MTKIIYIARWDFPDGSSWEEAFDTERDAYLSGGKVRKYELLQYSV